ncbi:hypothetical protein KIN20_031349 [Parelaphostrongylus tenuis]|uniref:Uncharacterized protein n=1 Tax=Parelaphostrongylus tenuis TaxID=148309 RepID=A0AAD5R5G5_PARTN|nr:hypothetical protein KIN20_031349 [Parelaphostrongylus tenuis]
MVSTKSPRFGAILAKMLSHHSPAIAAHPYLHLAAAAYWRQLGDLGEALSCYETATHYVEEAAVSGDESARISLDAITIAAATLFNKADQPESSIAILEHSFTLADPSAHEPCVFLKAQAALADATYMKLSTLREKGMLVEKVAEFTRFASHFSEPFIRNLTSAPNDSNYVAELLKLHEMLLQKLGAMSSNRKPFQENLDHLVSEKLRFNDIYGDQIKVADEIRERMVDDEVRYSLNLAYEEAKYGYNPYRVCRTANMKRFPRSKHPGNVMLTYHCELTDSFAYEEIMAPLRKATAKNRPLLNDTTWHVAEVFVTDKNFKKKLQSLSSKAPLAPQVRKKYPLDSEVLSTVRDRFWRRADWPSSVDCQTIISRTDIFKQRWFPQVFISPENKGFVVAEYLTRGIGLELHEDHPLPWKEPYCKEMNMFAHELSLFTGLLITVNTGPSSEYAESRLKSVLVRLAGRIMEDIEVAQRIRSMMDNNIGPRWLALNLAALYWRIKGNPKQASVCLLEAIVIQPGYADIALVQLAQLILKVTGQKDEVC